MWAATGLKDTELDLVPVTCQKKNVRRGQTCGLYPALLCQWEWQGGATEIRVWHFHLISTFSFVVFQSIGWVQQQLSAAYARRDCTKLLSSVLPDSWVFKWDSSCEAPANKQNPMRFSVAPFFHTSAASKQQPAEYPALSQSFLEGQQEKLVPASSLVLGS